MELVYIGGLHAKEWSVLIFFLHILVYFKNGVQIVVMPFHTKYIENYSTLPR
jgi:hypothetical protein